MRDLREYVDYYVPQLSGPMADHAWHSLVEAGPTALPEVVRAFGAASDQSVKARLVQVEALTAAKVTTTPEKQERIDEAIMQIGEGRMHVTKAADSQGT